MTRVKRGFVSRRKHKTTLKLTKGFRGKNQLFRVANQRKMKALTYAYDGRKQKKRDFRRLWICRLNATLNQQRLSYGAFVCKSQLSQIKLNRKCLSQMAIEDQSGFYDYVVMVNA